MLRHERGVHRGVHEGRRRAGAAGATSRALRSVGSTGSPLAPEGFRWVYDHVGADTWLFSTSGGTDVAHRVRRRRPDAARLRGRAAGARARRGGRGVGRGGPAGDRRGRRARAHRADAVDAGLLLGRRRRLALPRELLLGLPGRLAPRRLDRDHRRAARRSSPAAPTRRSTAAASASGRARSTARCSRCRRCVDALVLDLPRRGDERRRSRSSSCSREGAELDDDAARADRARAARGLLAAARPGRDPPGARGAADALREAARGPGEADPAGRRPGEGGEPRLAREPCGARLLRRARPHSR